MKKWLSLILIFMLSMCMMSACSKDVKDDDASNTVVEEESEEMTVFEDEDEGIELETQEVGTDFFYGTWIAETDRAKYMYGNVEITINEDGTWDGNITEEIVHGKWKTYGEGIKLTSELIPFYMSYSSNNNVVLRETDDAVKVVLTRQ